MTDPGTQPPAGRRTLVLLLVAVAAVVLVYFLVRSSRTGTEPQTGPGVTPTAEVATPTAVPAPPTPTRVAGGTEVPECKQFKDSLVLVGPDPATLSEDPVCVGPSNRVVWRSWDGQSELKIYFPVSGFPTGSKPDSPPFSEMRREKQGDKDDWVFKYPGKASVNSGKPRPEFGKPGKKYAFKYDQELNGKRVDGWIVIQK